MTKNAKFICGGRGPRCGHGCSSVVFVLCCVADHSSRGILPCGCLIVCGIETSTVRRPRPKLGCCVTER
jgi:hypothetical protein